MALCPVRSEDFMLHAQSRGIKVDGLWDVFGSEDDVVDGLYREGSHGSAVRTDCASYRDAKAATTQCQHVDVKGRVMSWS